MKKILIIMLFSMSSCAYKPSLLSNTDKIADTKNCFNYGSNISNRQEIYYKIKREFADYSGQKELRFYYDLDKYILQCSDSALQIQKIETEKLFFSDTGKVKNGILLSVDISFRSEDGRFDLKKFQIKKIGDFHSGFTATKKKTNNDISNLLKDSFNELSKQVSATISKL